MSTRVADYIHRSNTSTPSPPGFSDLATALHILLKFYVLRLYNLHTKQARDSLAMAFKLEEHLSEEAKNVPNGGHLGVLPCEVREKGLYPKVG